MSQVPYWKTAQFCADDDADYDYDGVDNNYDYDNALYMWHQSIPSNWSVCVARSTMLLMTMILMKRMVVVTTTKMMIVMMTMTMMMTVIMSRLNVCVAFAAMLGLGRRNFFSDTNSNGVDHHWVDYHHDDDDDDNYDEEDGDDDDDDGKEWIIIIINDNLQWSIKDDNMYYNE